MRTSLLPNIPSEDWIQVDATLPFFQSPFVLSNNGVSVILISYANQEPSPKSMVGIPLYAGRMIRVTQQKFWARAISSTGQLYIEENGAGKEWVDTNQSSETVADIATTNTTQALITSDASGAGTNIKHVEFYPTGDVDTEVVWRIYSTMHGEEMLLVKKYHNVLATEPADVNTEGRGLVLNQADIE